MTETNVKENNKIIAEFMELGSQLGMTEHIETGEYIADDEMEFHTSWDWLMPVIRKISSLYHKTEIISDEESDYCRITVYKDNVYSHEIFECGLCTMDATYQAVVEFIKFYNDQNKQTNEL